MKCEKSSRKKFLHKNHPIVITGQASSGKITCMARLLYETNSLPVSTIREIKRISKELGKDAECAFIIDQFKKQQEENYNVSTSQAVFSSGKRAVCIINPTGYKDLVQGLITGTLKSRVVILMIDVSEQAEKQVIHHVNLFKMLYIETMIVLLNKMDLINYDQKKFHETIQGLDMFLSRYSLSPPVYIPVSARQGDCITKKSSKMSWYKGPCILKALDAIQLTSKAEKNPLRFPVQDIYTIDGKTVLAGRIASGTVQRGKEIVIYPLKKKSRIAGIKTFKKKNVQKARAKENIGLILDTVVPVHRGDVIVNSKAEIHPVKNLKVYSFWKAGSPLKTGDMITLCCATQEITARVEKIENKINTSTLEKIESNNNMIGSNEAGTVIFNTEQPVIIDTVSFIEEMGRIILEKNNTVVGAGFV